MSVVPMIERRLTSDDRYAVCIHEAGHAVVALLGGEFVEAIAVAPEGATPEWVYHGRKRDTHEAWGVCRIDYAIEIPLFITRNWNEDEGRYISRGARSNIRRFLELCSVKDKRKTWRRIRAALCLILGGPIAERIYKGLQVDPECAIDWDDRTIGSDICMATAIAETLPRGFIREYDIAWKQTVTLLKDPEVWQHVVRLADELNQRGEIRYSWPDNFLGLDLSKIMFHGRRNFPRPPERVNRRTNV